MAREVWGEMMTRVSTEKDTNQWGLPNIVAGFTDLAWLY